MDCEKEYHQGYDYFCKKNHVKARPLLTMALNDERYRDLALNHLFTADIKDGNYAEARDLLNKYSHQNNLSNYMLFGMIEEIENNFIRSKEYYNMCMQDPEMQVLSLLKLSKIYVQLGDYDMAHKLLETVSCHEKYLVRAIFDLAVLYVIEGNYEHAYTVLQSHNLSKLNSRSLHNWRLMHDLISIYLGKLDPNDYKSADFGISYTMRQAINPQDERLLSHTRKHFRRSSSLNNGRFKPGIDLKNILEQVREKMKVTNPNHFQITDMYRFKLDEPVGYFGDMKTYDICAMTVVGTQNIITMYPVLLSNEFDKEKMSESEDLRLKRALGKVKNI